MSFSSNKGVMNFQISEDCLLKFKECLGSPLRLILASAFLAGCATDATIKERTPRFQQLHTVSTQAMERAAALIHAMRFVHEKPLVAIGENIQAARTALQELEANPSDVVALHDYNFAVSRILGSLRIGRIEPWGKGLVVPTATGSLLLTHKPDHRPQWNPTLYNFTPADEFTIGGKYVEEHSTRPGVGAPVVAVGRHTNPDWRSNYTTRRIYYGVTAVARFKGNICEIAFEDPLEKETTVLDGRTFPLAADFTVPLAVMLASTAPQVPKLERMLFPEKYAETAHLARIEPYDPKKTVVLLVHGLMDSPSTWAPMIINLRSDPYIRSHYQFWFYSYPSGYPYPYSASLLRKDLDDAERMFPLSKPIVVIGHSMGGCISRLLITDTGDKLWTLIFKKPPARTILSASTKKLLTDTLIFQHRPEIGRVIFISSPLRGSEMASVSLGRFGSMLIRTPGTLLAAGNDVFKVTTFNRSDLKLKRAPNSIDTLSPRNRFVKNINTIPVVPGIPYHTIIGDRGKGDSPKSSDGVVPYWSSHMEGAESECIVPSDHSAHQNPKSFAEVRRILKLNGENP